MLLLQRVLDGIFGQCDVVVQTRPVPFDIIGLPLIAFPIGFESSRGMDLPVAGMLGGMPYGEERLLSLVGAYQAVTDWHERRPPDPRMDGGSGDSGSGDGDAALRGRVGPRRDARPSTGAMRLDVHDVMAECE
jgi:hypothetical protein